MTIDKETQCSRVDQLSIETPSTPLRPFFLPLLISLSLSPSLASYYYYIIYKWERKPMSGCCIHTHFHWQKAGRGRTNQVLVTEATTNGWRQWDRHRMTVAATAAAAAVSFSFSIKSFMLCSWIQFSQLPFLFGPDFSVRFHVFRQQDPLHSAKSVHMPNESLLPVILSTTWQISHSHFHIFIGARNFHHI